MKCVEGRFPEFRNTKQCQQSTVRDFAISKRPTTSFRCRSELKRSHCERQAFAQIRIPSETDCEIGSSILSYPSPASLARMTACARSAT
jgi:hypothetical protein